MEQQRQTHPKYPEEVKMDAIMFTSRSFCRDECTGRPHDCSRCPVKGQRREWLPIIPEHDVVFKEVGRWSD